MLYIKYKLARTPRLNTTDITCCQENEVHNDCELNIVGYSDRTVSNALHEAIQLTAVAPVASKNSPDAVSAWILVNEAPTK